METKTFLLLGILKHQQREVRRIPQDNTGITKFDLLKKNPKIYKIHDDLNTSNILPQIH